jgi:hypothetical protein
VASAKNGDGKVASEHRLFPMLRKGRNASPKRR